MRLIRVSRTAEATYGVLVWSGVPFAVTLEDTWRDNAREVSCIPAGTYQCKRVDSPRFGDTFEITDVTGRSHILFHRGNTEDDTRGCVLVGEAFNPVNGRPGITASKEGFEEFLRLTRQTLEFQLSIEESL